MNPKRPPLYDPYLIPLIEAPRRQLSVLAVCSLLAALLLGPLGAIGGIVMGWVARREILGRPLERKGHTLATLGMALGIVMAVGWTAAAGVGFWIWNERQVELADDATPSPPVIAAVPDPTEPEVAEPQVRMSPTATPAQTGSVPTATVMHREGTITVVDVGVTALSLADELNKQRKEAEAAGQTLLVMTTRDPCEPCKGLFRALSSPQLQAALAAVRLVRVDIDVFRDDLDQLRIQRQRYPGFFLLAPDLSPRDGIDGGEWDDDIPVNIAPVLGPFVKGKYAQRRQTFRPMPRTGVAL
ncbi:MAG TPA: thioredoxin family protein [Polyangiaceae bacterium]|nr:thioredoxin family protein [Polyangiaceae bacterium]